MHAKAARPALTLFAVAAGVYLVAWTPTLGASPTYDEAVYLDLAQHPLRSSYYPDDPFLRHPPLSTVLLAGWTAVEDLPVRAWPAVWSLAGLALLAAALHAVRGPPWLMLVPVVTLPVAVPLVNVTMYPLLFACLALAAWGRAARHRWAELAGWNLAVLTHELALALLALTLLPRALRLLRERSTELDAWLSFVVPYPAGVAWGLVALYGVVGGGDARVTGILTGITSPTGMATIALLPVHSLVLGLAAGCLVWLASGARDRVASWGARWGAVGVIVISPFYRYLLVPVPWLVLHAAQAPDAHRPRTAALVLATALLSTVLGGALVLSGTDTWNGSDVPGLYDHGDAAALVAAGDEVLLRDPPALAYALQEEGWRVTATGPDGPSLLVLERQGETITLVRAGAKPEFQRAERHQTVLAATSWDDTIDELTARGWTLGQSAGGLVRLAPPAGTSA